MIGIYIYWKFQQGSDINKCIHVHVHMAHIYFNKELFYRTMFSLRRNGWGGGGVSHKAPYRKCTSCKLRVACHS